MNITHSYVLSPTEQDFTPNSPQWHRNNSLSDKQGLALHSSDFSPQTGPP